jgi:hypothetical protein
LLLPETSACCFIATLNVVDIHVTALHRLGDIPDGLSAPADAVDGVLLGEVVDVFIVEVLLYILKVDQLDHLFYTLRQFVLQRRHKAHESICLDIVISDDALGNDGLKVALFSYAASVEFNMQPE